MGGINPVTTSPVRTTADNIVEPALAGKGLVRHELIPEHLAREDLAFCLPLLISLGHVDLAGALLIALHLTTLVIVSASLPSTWGLVLAFAVVVSLVSSVRAQRRIADFESLCCDQAGQWSLVGGPNIQDHSRQWVRLDSLVVAGPYCLIRLRRFGSSVYWITAEQHQARTAWCRLRVLSRLI